MPLTNIRPLGRYSLIGTLKMENLYRGVRTTYPHREICFYRDEDGRKIEVNMAQWSRLGPVA